MTAITDAIDATRERLLSALHDELQGALDLAAITRVADLALDRMALETLLTTVEASETAVASLVAEVGTPPTAVQADIDAAQERYDETHAIFY